MIEEALHDSSVVLSNSAFTTYLSSNHVDCNTHQDLTQERRLAEEGLEGDERDCTIEVDDE